MPKERTPIEQDEKKQAFLTWLCTAPSEREPRTMEELAPILGVHHKTLSNWKKDPEFLAAWQERSSEVIGNPDRAKEVLDGLFFVARDVRNPKQIAAAKLYLEAIDAIKPKKVDVTVATKAASRLTEEELQQIAAHHAQLELSRRGA